MKLDIDQMAPASGRRRTLVKALKYIHAGLDHEPMIVEVGTIRDARPSAHVDDGWATLVFGWYASQTAGWVITIDSDPSAMETCKRVTENYWRWIQYRLATPERSALEILSRINARIDLLYLDGPHGSPAEHDAASDLHLEWYRCLKQHPRLILIDDASAEDLGVKARLVVPAAREDGYAILFQEGSQVALVMDGSGLSLQD